MAAVVVCMACFLGCFQAAIMSPKPGSQQATTDRDSERFNILDFVVSERSFTQIVDGLELEYSNAEPLYRAYERRLVEIESRYAQLIRDAGEEEMNALRALLDPLHYGIRRPESLEEIRDWQAIAESNRNDERWHDVEAIYRKIARLRSTARRQSEAERRLLIQRLCEQFEISDDVREAIMRALRRDLLDMIPRNRRGDFMTAADVVNLVEAASQTKGELHVLGLDFESKLNEILAHYEIRLDSVLLRELKRHRRVPDRDDRMVVGSDEPGWNEIQDDLLKRWHDRFVVSASAARSIEDLLLANRMTTRARDWMRRYFRSICPELMEERWPMQMVEWLESQDEVTDAQLTVARQLLDEYESRLHTLQESAVRSGVIARRGNVFLRGTNEDVMQYFDDLLRIHALANQTVRRLASVLSTTQRVELERIFVDAERRHAVSTMFGPRIDPDALTLIDVHDVYGRNPLRTDKKGNER